jgi:hypothetical protein
MFLFMSNLKIPPLRIVQTGAVASILLLAFVVWVYFFDPLSAFLSPFWADKVLDLAFFLPALGAAVSGTFLTRQFTKGEVPYLIWQAFTVGLWCWTAGEVAGAVNDVLYWETTYPSFSAADALWLAGYFFLGLSLYYQFRLVYGSAMRSRRRIYLLLVAIALLVTAGLTALADRAGLGGGYAWIILFVTVLYPVLDATQGTAAIWLSFLFGRGQWSRPWWGLILFALADSIDAFYWLGGYDLIPPAAQSTLNYISVAAYPASYMVAGLTLLANYFILRYGRDSGLMKVPTKMKFDK